MIITCDERGNETCRSYFGTDGKPCLIKAGIAGWTSAYDERGNNKGMSYFDTEGKPCSLKDGYAGWKATYDEWGNQISHCYFGLDGKPYRRKEGYAHGRPPTTTGETGPACPASAPTASPA